MVELEQKNELIIAQTLESKSGTYIKGTIDDIEVFKYVKRE